MAEPLVLRRAVTTQIDWWWKALFRRRLDGLTDEELWWEPAPDCWTLHADDTGAYRYEWPPQSQGDEVPPFTTIAWRLCHVSLSGLWPWSRQLAGDAEARAKVADQAFPPTADAAVALVDECWQRWRDEVRRLTDDDLWTPIGETALGTDAPVMKLGASDPLLHHLLHQQRELIHHGAEVSLLRDLYRSRGGRP